MMGGLKPRLFRYLTIASAVVVLWLAGMTAPLAAQNEYVQSEAEQAEAIKELDNRRSFVAAPAIRGIRCPSTREGGGAVSRLFAVSRVTGMWG
jgi:hypothetical protein